MVPSPKSSLPRSRRRSPAADPLKKTTLQMHTSTLEAVKRAVDSGAAASQNEFVEEAILSRLREIRRAKVYAAYAEAAADPLFMRDMEEVTDAFDAAVDDGLAD